MWPPCVSACFPWDPLEEPYFYQPHGEGTLFLLGGQLHRPHMPRASAVTLHHVRVF